MTFNGTDLNKKFRFRKFSVYQDARMFASIIKKISKTQFPNTELFGLSSQINRALDSIILNIAEGADRGTDKDFAHFLNLAHTSLNEVVACLDIALDNRYINESVQTESILKAAKLGDQLTAFRRKILTDFSKVKG